MDWDSKFCALFERCEKLYRAGRKDWTGYYTDGDLDFLASIGCQPREFFDFVEDFCDFGEPGMPCALLVAAVRRDYFLTKQNGEFSAGEKLTRETAPSFKAELGGFVYLPRLLAKAEAKLRGELDPDLMYGCGADRKFFSEQKIHPADFLRHVWASGGDGEKVVQWLKCPKV